jgi:Cu-processing system permease protein
MNKIIKYIIIDLLRNKIVIGYTVFLLILSASIFNLGADPSKGILSLLNIVLIFVPLVSIIFSTIYLYNSSEFIELMRTQPLKRKTILLSEFAGISSALLLAVFIGVGIPVIIFDGSNAGWWLIIAALFLTIIFVALAFWASVATRDKSKGIGTSILLWFYFALIYDGLVLFILFSFSDYSLEKPMLAMCALNPIDLARIAILLKLDVSALMGYTGAVFQQFFGSSEGVIFVVCALVIWAVLPCWRAFALFKKKDL